MDVLPKVSVIIPAFNGSDFLPDAMASIRAQNYPNLEVLIIDDGSSDGLAESVARIAPEARYFRQDNQGPAAARNLGIRNAVGEIIAPIDIDDIWPADSLNVRVQALIQDPEADLVQGFSQNLVQTDNGEWTEWLPPGATFLFGATLINARVFSRIGLFDERLRFGEDLDWILRTNEAGLRKLEVQQIVLLRRLHTRNMTLGQSWKSMGALKVLHMAVTRRRAASLKAEPE